MRHIALPEFQPGLDIEIMPPSSYLEKTNGTLHAQNCRLLTDNNGFMISGRPPTAASKKIILLGNSTIENLYIPLESRVASKLEMLADMHGVPTTAFNAAISNAHTLHLINIVLNKGLSIRPDGIIYYPPCGFDTTANELENSFWHPDFSPVRMNKSPSWRPPTLNLFPNKNGFRDTERLLGVLDGICKNFDVKLLLSIWPLYGAYDSFMARLVPDQRAFEDENARMADLNLVIRAFSENHELPLIDLEKHFADLDHGRYFYDWNHPNIDGCDVIAGFTNSVLQKVW